MNRRRFCLQKGGSQETVFAEERTELLNLVTELMVNPQPAVIAEMIPTEELRSRELSIKEQELRLREAELQQQARDRDAERELERFRLQSHAAERQAELDL